MRTATKATDYSSAALQSRRLRCAVYTRKSSEEGLEQEFNSLDAQHEACAAFIASQAGLGWALVPDRYDDGGISGGTMERPALQRLLQHIRDRKIDIVVVYKIDRLTRSLMDFSRIVEIFDASSASFVSVTQQFNTTTSMGRLTLNVLLSFAQFEREVTAERIRDKIAASKKKGMWMGGRVPFGYRVENRRLVIDEADAANVRWMFDRVIERRNVAEVIRDVQRSGMATRLIQQQLSTGKLRYLLSNPVYIGKVRHKEVLHDGEHAAIISPVKFADVQAIIRRRTPARRSSTNTRDVHLLSGILVDEAGHRLRPTHASNRGKRYRYYVGGESGWSIPAGEIEALTISKLQSLLADHATIHDWLARREFASSFKAACETANSVTDSLDEVNDADCLRSILRTAYRNIRLGSSSVRFEIDVDALVAILVGSPSPISDFKAPLIIDEPVAIQRRGKEQRIIIDSKLRSVEPDPALVNLIGRAHSYLASLTDGSCASIGGLANQVEINHADISRILPLAFLSPGLALDILTGRQSSQLTASRLSRAIDLPASWKEQAAALHS